MSLLSDAIAFFARLSLALFAAVFAYLIYVGDLYDRYIKGSSVDPAGWLEPWRSWALGIVTADAPWLPYVILVAGAFLVFHGERRERIEATGKITTLETSVKNLQDDLRTERQDSRHLRQEMEQLQRRLDDKRFDFLTGRIPAQTTSDAVQPTTTITTAGASETILQDAAAAGPYQPPRLPPASQSPSSETLLQPQQPLDVPDSPTHSE